VENRWRRPALGVLAGLLCCLPTGCGLAGGPSAAASGRVSFPPGPSASPSPSRPPSPSPSPSPSVPVISYPQRGAGTFEVAPAGSPVAGTAGRLLAYRVVVEHGIEGITAADFARQVSTVLSDPRSWVGTGDWRLRQVAAGERYDFTVYLATPATRDVLCADGYDQYTSCRNRNSVVLNVARWVHGVPNYGESLEVYREYMVNHETGHRLGWGHELCPAPGQPAPVMQQQTLGLHGCVANAWPVPSGRSYHGRSGQYDDPIPHDQPPSQP
jgi:hypothetical protein